MPLSEAVTASLASCRCCCVPGREAKGAHACETADGADLEQAALPEQDPKEAGVFLGGGAEKGNELEPTPSAEGDAACEAHCEDIPGAEADRLAATAAEGAKDVGGPVGEAVLPFELGAAVPPEPTKLFFPSPFAPDLGKTSLERPPK